jgi:hypothetical protein
MLHKSQIKNPSEHTVVREMHLERKKIRSSQPTLALWYVTLGHGLRFVGGFGICGSQHPTCQAKVFDQAFGGDVLRLSIAHPNDKDLDIIFAAEVTSTTFLVAQDHGRCDRFHSRSPQVSVSSEVMLPFINKVPSGSDY